MKRHVKTLAMTCNVLNTNNTVAYIRSAYIHITLVYDVEVITLITYKTSVNVDLR